MTQDLDLATTARLLGACAALEPLQGWDQALHLLGAAQAALGGATGLTPVELRRLRDWPIRWHHLHPELRSFYLVHAPSCTTASVALWRILEGDRTPLAGWQRGKLRQLWTEAHGAPPYLDLCPHLDRRTDP